jgi:hypothetical protein
LPHCASDTWPNRKEAAFFTIPQTMTVSLIRSMRQRRGLFLILGCIGLSHVTRHELSGITTCEPAQNLNNDIWVRSARWRLFDPDPSKAHPPELLSVGGVVGYGVRPQRHHLHPLGAKRCATIAHQTLCVFMFMRHKHTQRLVCDRCTPFCA